MDLESFISGNLRNIFRVAFFSFLGFGIKSASDGSMICYFFFLTLLKRKHLIKLIFCEPFGRGLDYRNSLFSTLNYVWKVQISKIYFCRELKEERRFCYLEVFFIHDIHSLDRVSNCAINLLLSRFINFEYRHLLYQKRTFLYPSMLLYFHVSYDYVKFFHL